MKHATMSEFLTRDVPTIHIEPRGGRFTIPNLPNKEVQVVSEVYQTLFPGRPYDEVRKNTESQYVMPSLFTFVGHFKEPSEALRFTRAIEGLEQDATMLSQVANSIENLDTFHKRWEAEKIIKKAEKVVKEVRREGRIQNNQATQQEQSK